VIAGSKDADYHKLLTEHIRSLEITKHVRFLTDISDEFKEMLLPAADVFVGPVDSIQESFGLAPVEAMACGVPQVVADWDGFRDTVVHGETGFLVPTYWCKCDSELNLSGEFIGWELDHLGIGGSIAVDLDALAHFLETLLINEPLRHSMAENSRRRAVSLFGFAPVVRQYEQLWGELVKRSTTISSSAKRGLYLRPSYFDLFEGHASTVLTDSSTLVVTEQGVQSLGLPNSISFCDEILAPRMLDPRLMKQMLEYLVTIDRGELMGATSFSCGLTIETLVHKFGNSNGSNHDRLRRHLMWLLKYGLIRYADNHATHLR
jgi:hypothetical protein